MLALNSWAGALTFNKPMSVYGTSIYMLLSFAYELNYLKKKYVVAFTQASMVHSLIEAYGLLKYMRYVCIIFISFLRKIPFHEIVSLGC